MLVPNATKFTKLTNIKVDRNPYIDRDYFIKNNAHLTIYGLRKTIYIKYNFKCAVCNGPLAGEEEIQLHHIVPVKDGGKATIDNLVPVHTTCHKTITYAGVEV